MATMTERNESICRAYSSGMTLYQCSDQFGLSHERIRQILRKAGIFKRDRLSPSLKGLALDGSQVRSGRDEFLGVNLTEEDKTALRAEAERRGISMSMLTSDLIKEMLASVKEA